MDRRSFLGWLGGSAGALAVYRAEPDLTAATQTLAGDTRDAKPSSTFTIRNESEKPYVVAYTRVTRAPDFWKSDPHDVHKSWAPLLPGEELTITAVEMKIP